MIQENLIFYEVWGEKKDIKEVQEGKIFLR